MVSAVVSRPYSLIVIRQKHGDKSRRPGDDARCAQLGVSAAFAWGSEPGKSTLGLAILPTFIHYYTEEPGFLRRTPASAKKKVGSFLRRGFHSAIGLAFA